MNALERQLAGTPEAADAAVGRLRASVEHHIGEEERAMFVEARNHLTDDRLQALGRRMVSLLEKRPGEVTFT